LKNKSYTTKRGRKASAEYISNEVYGKISISSMTQEGLNSMSFFIKEVTEILMNGQSYSPDSMNFNLKHHDNITI
jgi:hypothetical protein